jgi:hypothetical protein
MPGEIVHEIGAIVGCGHGKMLLVTMIWNSPALCETLDGMMDLALFL